MRVTATAPRSMTDRVRQPQHIRLVTTCSPPRPYDAFTLNHSISTDPTHSNAYDVYRPSDLLDALSGFDQPTNDLIQRSETAHQLSRTFATRQLDIPQQAQPITRRASRRPLASSRRPSFTFASLATNTNLDNSSNCIASTIYCIIVALIVLTQPPEPQHLFEVAINDITRLHAAQRQNEGAYITERLRHLATDRISIYQSKTSKP